MSLHDKLERWRQAGLLDAQSAARIAAFEESRRTPVTLYAVAALGAGTVGLGLISIVAANWDAIPSHVKLAVDLLIGAALAVATRMALRRQAELATEVLVTLLYGFTLASLGLVGQVYQLGTPTYQALLAWTVSTGPLVLLARSRYVASLALAGLVVTHGTSLEALFEHLGRTPGLSDRAAADVIASTLFLSPPLYVALGRSRFLTMQRAQHAHALAQAGWLGVALGGFALSFVWYEAQTDGPWLAYALGVGAAICATLAALLPKMYPERGKRAQVPLAWALGLAWLSLALGSTLVRTDLPFVGALFQLGFLGALGWAAIRAGSLRVFNALTAAIALRILAVYFEVFHSLFSTGLGLVTGGLLTLTLAWAWRRQTKTLVAAAQAPDGGGGHG